MCSSVVLLSTPSPQIISILRYDELMPENDQSSYMRQGLDALMSALQTWNGGVIIISHDERFITTVATEVISRGYH